MIETLRNAVTYDVLDVIKDEAVMLIVRKNAEILNLVFTKNADYENFCIFAQLQHKYGFMNGDSTQFVLNTMLGRNSNWVLLDNNLNFVQCFTDKQYYPVCKDTKQSYFRSREWYGAIDKKTDQKQQPDDIYKYRVWIEQTKEFLFDKEKPNNQTPTELLYLFHKVDDKLILHTIFNKSKIYIS